MTVLIVAEHDGASLLSPTLNAVTAGTQLGEVHILVAGHECEKVAQAAAAISGVSKVLYVDAPHYRDGLAEQLAALVAEHAGSYAAILAAETTSGKDLMPRVAALMDVMQISGIIAVKSADTFVRPIYAGNALATVQSSDVLKVITVRTTAFPPAAADGGSAEVVAMDLLADPGLSHVVERELQKSDRPELTTAKIVLSGGRGLQSRENFKLLESLADKLGAAIGASRAAVDAGYISNDHQVGQTGRIVAPKLYIAVGISGAIQHLAGMKDSKIIVAINKDEDAPIFEVADYGLVGDLFEVLPEFEAELDK